MPPAKGEVFSLTSQVVLIQYPNTQTLPLEAGRSCAFGSCELSRQALHEAGEGISKS